MGMDLSGAGGRFRFTGEQWIAVLRLGCQYGWEAAGTEAPELPDENGEMVVCDGWEGSYGFNDFQTVTADDAKNLADAIERALPDVPDKAPTHKFETLRHSDGTPMMMPLIYVRRDKVEVIKAGGVPMRALKNGESLSHYEHFAGCGKDLLREFITFCRAGAFRIA